MSRNLITNNEILDLYNQGFSQKDILQKYKVSIMRIRKVLQQSGHNTASYKKFDDEFILAILELLCAGYKQKDIATLLDCPITTIRDVVHKYDLSGIAIKSRQKAKEEKILQMYKSGVAKPEICQQMKIQTTSLNKILKDNGLIVDRSEKYKRIIKLYDQGLTITAICDKENTSYRTVKKVVKGRVMYE